MAREKGGPSPVVLSADDVAGICSTAGWRGEDLAEAIAVAYAESRFDIHASNVNDDPSVTDPHGRYWKSVDRGLFELNSVSFKGLSKDDFYDPEKNAAAAYDRWRALGGTFKGKGGWTTANNGDHEQYMDMARAAAVRVVGGTQYQVDAAGSVLGAKTSDVINPDPRVQTIVKATDKLPDIIFGGGLLEEKFGIKSLLGVTSSVVGAPSLDLSTDETSQLEFTVIDPRFEVWNHEAAGEGALVTFGDLRFEVDAVEMTAVDGVPGVKFTARSDGIVRLQHEEGAKVEQNVSATQYISKSVKKQGLNLVAQGTQVRPVIAREFDATVRPGDTKRQTEWQVFKKLAEEESYLLFEAMGTLYFGKPTWFLTRPGAKKYRIQFVAKGGGTDPGILTALTVPTLRKIDRLNTHEGSVEVRQEVAAQMRPGDILQWASPFFGDYIITNVRIELDGVSNGTIDFRSATDLWLKKRDLAGAVEETPGTYVEDSDPAVVVVPPGVKRLEESEGYRFRWPVSGTISSQFGVDRGDHKHTGIDIAKAKGTPIFAAAAGDVKFAGTRGGYGHLVILNHGGGLETWYGHMDKFYVEQQANHPIKKYPMYVEKGQAIGTVGLTGHTTGAHLHFEVRVNGTPKNPLDYLPPWAKRNSSV